MDANACLRLDELVLAISLSDLRLSTVQDVGVGIVLTRKHCWTEGENDVEGVRQKKITVSSIIEPVGHICVTISGVRCDL